LNFLADLATNRHAPWRLARKPPWPTVARARQRSVAERGPWQPTALGYGGKSCARRGPRR
jgi:hypothetical protein